MFIGVPLYMRNGNNLREMVNTFGQFHYWDEEDPYLVRAMVFASFPDVQRVPRDVVIQDFAAYGGARVNWTAACYVVGANWANQLPDDEDPMPLDGNPHPLPGQLQPYNVNFVLPPYPAIGWNEPPVEEPQDVPQDNWGHAQWGDEPVIEDIYEPVVLRSCLRLFN